MVLPRAIANRALGERRVVVGRRGAKAAKSEPARIAEFFERGRTPSSVALEHTSLLS
jgi:hypothetical protein